MPGNVPFSTQLLVKETRIINRINRSTNSNLQKLTWLEVHREPKVGGLEGCILGLVGQQEVLGLQVPVHDAQGVASLDHPHNRAQRGRRLLLSVVTLGNNAVKQLACTSRKSRSGHTPDGLLTS
jgi:hypothetical protein